MKVVKRLFIGLIVLIVLGMIGGIFFIDALAKKAVETGGRLALGVPVVLDSASIRPLSGRFGVERMRIANPPGFTQPDLFSMRSAEIALPLSSLMEKRVIVPRLEIEGISISLERNKRGTNYGALLNNLSRFESGEPAPDVEADAGGGKTFVLRELRIRDIHAAIALLPEFGDATKASLSIPVIVVENLGTEMSMAQLCSLVVKTVFKTAIEQGSGVVPEDMRQELKARLDQLEVSARALADEKLQGMRDKLEGAGVPLGDAADKALKEAGQKLDGLLKKKE